MSRALKPRLLLSLFCCLLVACGGGERTPTGVAAANVAPSLASFESASTGISSPLTAQSTVGAHRIKALSAGPYGTAQPIEAANQLLDFAETEYSMHFPDSQTTQTYERFLYRYYPATGKYVGVATNVVMGDGLVEGGVYVMGGDFGNTPSFVGNISDFIPVSAGLLTRSWTQQQRDAGGGRFLGRLNGNLISFGNGLMISPDNGDSWNTIQIPAGQNSIIASHKGRLVLLSESFQYRTSGNNGKTWTSPKRLPGLDSKYQNTVNAADCIFSIGDKLFAYSNFANVQAWVSTDAKIFREASGDEVQIALTKLNVMGIAQNGCRGQVDGPQNLLEPWLTSKTTGSRYFRTTGEPNPAATSDPMTFSNYTLNVSSDLNRWIPLSLPKNVAFLHISEIGPQRFIGVAQRVDGDFSHKYITMISTDSGLNWRGVGGVDNLDTAGLYRLSSIGNVNVAVGDNGLIKVSNDQGVTWINSSVSPKVRLWDIANNGTNFVAVGNGGTILLSTDLGKNWSVQTTGYVEDLRAIAYGNGKFLVTGPSGVIYSSIDGMNWGRIAQGLVQFAPLSYGPRLVYGNGVFVATFPQNVCVGSSCSSGSSGVFVSSDDGKSWVKTLPSGKGLTYGNGVFVTLLDDGVPYMLSVVSSPDGRRWTTQGEISSSMGDIQFGDGIMASAGMIPFSAGGYILGVNYSDDLGAHWRTVEIPGGVGTNLFFNGFRWIGLGGYGQPGVIATSAAH